MDTTPQPYCFGVRPGGVFLVREANATFHVVNEGAFLLRVTVEVLAPPPVVHPGPRVP
ncbi:hypothetical protein AB4Y36_38320 [Paraburkholderia sp. BR10936]|uniref:hypothetical protein n=1 Tax=Paraburkholderia sp. BR10936 TaxID=3236993 RepID=UPI0034D36B31